MDSHHFRVVMVAWAVMFAGLLTIALVAGERLRDNQLAGCMRGNAIKVETNERTVELTKMKNVIEAVVRNASSNPDNKGVAVFSTAADRLSDIKFGRVPLTDCESVIKRNISIPFIN